MSDSKKASSEFKFMVNANIWHDNLDETIAFIKAATAPRVYDENKNEIPGNLYWSWARNPDCKYVSLRIDMRDGDFVLLDRNGERIELDQLKYQYRSDEESQ